MIQLWQRIRDCVPRALALYKDVAIRTEPRILIERASWHLEPARTRRGIRYRRPAPQAERGAVGRRDLADWCFIPADQLSAGEKSKVFCANAEPGNEGGTRRLPTACAVT